MRKEAITAKNIRKGQLTSIFNYTSKFRLHSSVPAHYSYHQNNQSATLHMQNYATTTKINYGVMGGANLIQQIHNNGNMIGNFAPFISKVYGLDYVEIALR